MLAQEAIKDSDDAMDDIDLKKTPDKRMAPNAKSLLKTTQKRESSGYRGSK